MIGKTMEVYIDNMLVKSLRVVDHDAHLEETFGILHKHRMMLAFLVYHLKSSLVS